MVGGLILVGRRIGKILYECGTAIKPVIVNCKEQ